MENVTVSPKVCGTLRPVALHFRQPTGDGPAEIALTSVFIAPELSLEAHGSEDRNPLFPPGPVATPSQPQVEVETTGRIHEAADSVKFAGDRVGLNLLPEALTEFYPVLDA